MSRFPWTPALKAVAVKRFVDGESATMISRNIGAPDIVLRPSRNAIIGIVHRAGAARSPGAAIESMRTYRAAKPKWKALKPAPAPKPAKPTKAPKPEKPRLVHGGNNQVIEAGPDRAPIVPPPRADAYKALPGTSPQPFEDRPAKGCRWPIDRPGDNDHISRLSCCADREGAGPYCPTHAALGRSAQSPKHKTGNDLARALRRFA